MYHFQVSLNGIAEWACWSSSSILSELNESYELKLWTKVMNRTSSVRQVMMLNLWRHESIGSSEWCSSNLAQVSEVRIRKACSGWFVRNAYSGMVGMLRSEWSVQCDSANQFHLVVANLQLAACTASLSGHPQLGQPVEWSLQIKT